MGEASPSSTLPDTVAELRTMTGVVLRRVELRPNEVAAVVMKEALASLLDRQDQMLARFLYASMLIPETMFVKDVGFPPTGVAEVSVVVDCRPAFQWKYSRDGHISAITQPAFVGSDQLHAFHVV